VRVFVVRHAEAAPGDPDHLRSLTKTGRKEAEALGRKLAKQDIDAIVSSPLVRAEQTADAIAAATNLAVELDDRLAPGATAEDLRAAVAGRGETVVTVGHQPDCSAIVLELTGREVRFKTAGFHEVDL
jgi:phosphohistidine phosphatase SixA